MPLDLSQVDFESLDSANEDKDLLRSNLQQASSINPDEHAKKKQLSEKTGVPTFAVDESVETQFNLDNVDFESLTKQSPVTARHLSNFDNAIVAQDDIEVLQALEESLAGATPASAQKAAIDRLKTEKLPRTVEIPPEAGKLYIEGEISPAQLPESLQYLDPRKLKPGKPTLESLLPASDVGRLETAGSQFVRGMTGVFTSVPKTLSAEATYGVRNAVLDTPEGAALLMRATNGDPLAALTLDELNKAFDPRKAEGYKMADSVDEYINKSFEINPEYAEEFIAGQIPQGLGSAVGFMTTLAVTRGTGVLGTAGMGYAANAQSQFQEALGKGADIDDAMRASRLAGIMGTSEALPISNLLNRIDKGTGGSIKRAISEALKQGTEEAIQESMQTIWSNIIASDLVAYDPDRKMLTGVGEAGAAGFTVGSLLTTVGFMVAGGYRKAKSKIDAVREQSSDAVSNVEQERIDSLNNLSSRAKLRGRDRESFRQFVEQSDGDNNTHVFIDSSQVALYLQDKTPEQIESDPALKLLNDQRNEAATLGTDVQIPVADFAADIAGTEHFDNLRESMTMSEQSTSPFRQEQDRQETETYIQTLMAEAQENANEYVEAQDIYEQVRSQLIDTGAVSPANASIMAQIVPAWATAQARRQGKTVAQVYQDAGLTIEGPVTGERARLEAEKETVEQVAVPTAAAIDPAQAWAEHHEAQVQMRGLTPEQASAVAPEPDIDPLTGLYTDTELLPALDRAKVAEPSVYVESDLFNLGGMNKALGANVRADAVLKQIAAAYESAFQGVPVFRRGAGRMSAIVPQGFDVNQVLTQVNQEVARIAKENNLENIPAPKVAGQKGIGLYSGVSNIETGATINEIIGGAQEQINAAMPQGEQDVNREQTFQAWAESSSGRPEGIAARVAEQARGAEAADSRIQGQALERAGADPAAVISEGDRAFATPAQVRRAQFEERAAGAGLTVGQAEPFRPTTRKDPLTGWFTDRDRIPTIERAQQYVDETGGNAVYVVADISNLGGLNLALGENLADIVFRNMAQIVGERAAAIPGAESVPFRHGGDEISFVITGADETAVQQAMDQAAAEVAGYIEAIGLQDLPHAKEPTNKARAGSGVYIGIQDVGTTAADINDVVDAADAMVELGKMQPKVESVPVQVRGEAGEQFAQPAYHGTHARDIEKFSLEFVGTGEGAQAQGFGLYFASQQDIAEFYRESVSGASREIINVKLGDIPFYKNGTPVDYSPKNRSYEESARAKFVEDVLINEWEFRQAIDENRGEEYLRDALQEQIDSLEEEREYNLDDAEYYDASISYLEKHLDKDVKIESKELGQVYEVEVPDDSDLYDWDAPIEGNIDLMRVAESLVGEDRIAEVLELLEENASLGFTDVEDAFESALLTNDLDSLEKIKDFIEDADAIAEFENLKDEIGFDFDVEADTGQSVYETLASRFGELGAWDVEGQKQASHIMQQAGYKGHKYLDARSRDPETDMPSYNYVIWDEDSIQIRDVFYQKSFLQGEDGKRQPRGYYEPANNIIRLTEAADLSTFLHEFAHFMYEMEVNGNTELLQSINGWYKRNAKDVAKEANSYLADKFDAEKQLEQPAFHGTPHRFDKFSLDAIGTGEGAQAYGWGLYFASKRSVAEWYRDKLSGGAAITTLMGDPQAHAYQMANLNGVDSSIARIKSELERGGYPDENKQHWVDVLSQLESGNYANYKPEKGALYQVDIPEADALLDWDKPLNEQSAAVQEILIKEFPDLQETARKEAAEGDELLAALGQPTGEGASFKLPSITGEQFYRAISRRQAKKRGDTGGAVISSNDAEASKLLNSIGIPGLRYLDGTSRGTDGDTHNYVIWDENQVTIEAVNDELVQAERFEQPQQPPTAKAGTITEADVISFLDQTTTGDKDKDAAIRRAVHEQFARGFESYLMEGKAPSIELRNAFRTFARWLARIYQSVRGQLKVNLDDEMRQVFDRLLATDEQIAAAEARARVEPMFTDAAMGGMTDEEFAAYQKRQEKVKDVQAETLRDKLIQQLTRQTKAWWKEEKQGIIDDEMETLSRQQVHVARARLRDGDMKLDHATVKEMVGEAKTDKLGRTSVVIPPKLVGLTAKGQQGVHPDEAAAFFGYRSGAEMLNDLATAPSIKEEAEVNAEAQMIERHGDILTDGTIEKEADEAVQNEERGKLILAELKALSKGTKIPTIDRVTIKDIAEERIGRLAFREIHPGKYRKAEIKAAQEAARMLAEGNREGAAQAKMRQVMNYYLGMSANNAKNDTMKIVDRMNRYSKKKVREEIMKAEGGYWDQIAKILNRFEFRKSATLKEVESLNTWMKERMEVDGDGLVLSNAVLNESYVTHWKNVPFSDLQGINDSVKNIEHVARYANKLTRMQEEITFNNLVERMVISAEEKVKTRFKSKRTDVAEGKNWGRWLMAQMTKIPFLTSWMDGGERAGLWHQALVQPFTDAYNTEIKLWEKAGKPVMDMIVNRSKADIKRHNRKVYIKEIDDNLYGHQILAVALNTGNQSNLKKLLLGEGWADPENEAEISFDNPKLQAVLSRMTKDDWKLVQSIWDQMETLYPELAEVHRRTTGLTPPKIEATPVKTKFGTFKGGYYPVKYDPNRDFKAALNEDKLNAEVESMFSNGASIQASVNAGATNERTGYYAPIRLSLDVVPSHFQETIHYITHHDAVREVNRLIRNKRIATVMKEKLGPEEYAQMKPWLNDIAKDGREAPTKMFWDDMLQRLRFGVTLGAMGFKASTGLIQISGLSNTVAETGLGPVMQSMRSILGSTTTMKQAWNFAVENSNVLEHRAQTMDREIKNAMSRLEGKRGILPAVQEVSMKHIALIQTYMVDLPSWHAAYIKGMKEWGDEARSFQYADWVIENVQGSGATKDLARIMRGQTETGRMFTMFMTFFSSLWNMERDLVKGARSGRYSTTSVAAKAMFLFTLPVLFEMMMRGELGEPDDEDDRLQQMLLGVAMYPIQSVPFVRDVANATTGEFGYNISPLQSIIEQGTRTIPEIVTRGFTDEEITKGQVKGATKFIGAAVGIPGTGQAWATGEHLYNVIEDGEEFTMQELLFGPKRD